LACSKEGSAQRSYLFPFLTNQANPELTIFLISCCNCSPLRPLVSQNYRRFTYSISFRWKSSPK